MSPYETCDDGNAGDNKGCLSDCSGIMKGWNCYTYGGGKFRRMLLGYSLCYAYCGEGLVVEDEPCDDQNKDPLDGCDQCVVTDGYYCIKEPSECSLIPTCKSDEYLTDAYSCEKCSSFSKECISCDSSGCTECNDGFKLVSGSCEADEEDDDPCPNKKGNMCYT